MPHPWPADTVFSRLELEPQNRDCPDCSRRLRLCDHRHRRLFTFDGPLHLVCKLAHCPDPLCPQHYRTVSPEDEAGIALPRWIIGWDVFAWIGHRRFARHWSITQIKNELADTYAIMLSADTLEDTLRRYQTMVAARHSDPSRLAAEYAEVEDLVLSIDGLQPEKGHETLYVVRELRRQRVWFAESLLSSSAGEVQRLLEQAKEWAERLGKPVAGWVSDKQDAFVTGIAAVFPGVPHRYCHNHFLRDLAKPTMELDSHAKVQMRSKVRGLRELERQVLSQRAAVAAANTVTSPDPAAVEAERAAGKAAGSSATSGAAANSVASPDPAAVEELTAGRAAGSNEAGGAAASAVAAAGSNETGGVAASAVVSAVGEAAVSNDTGGEVVLDYCAMVRGILNDDQGGPLHPPGLRMAEALTEVRASLQRNLEAKKGGPQRSV